MEPFNITFKAFKWDLTNYKNLDNSDDTIIYITGLTKKSESVIVRISDFKPDIYIELDSKIKWDNSKIQIFLSYLKTIGISYIKYKFIDSNLIYYYKKGNFLRLWFNNKKQFKNLETIFKKEIYISGIGTNKLKFIVHEQEAEPELKLQALLNIKPCDYINVKGTIDNFSLAKYSINASYTDIKSVKENFQVNPLIISYDIECVSDDPSGNTFSDPEKKNHPIICICCTVARLNDDEKEWKYYALINAEGERNVESIKDIENCEIINFDNEKKLILGFIEFHKRIKSDLILGYNTLCFDDNYIIERAKIHNISLQLKKMGKIKTENCEPKKRIWSSSAYKDQSFNYIDLQGVLHIDLFPAITKDNPTLNSYNLDYVSEIFLGEHKDDLTAKEMTILYYTAGSKGMKKIVKYCIQDTKLPLKLFIKLKYWIGLCEMSNVFIVQIFDLLTRGQQIRVYSQIYVKSKELNYVVNSKWSHYPEPTEKEKQYVGAKVQNPKAGYWEKVPTYDFQSLYPTSIIAYNICFSTYIKPDEKVDPNDCHTIHVKEHSGCQHDNSERKTKVKKIICNEYFVRFWKAEIKKGLVPLILQNLLDARAATRAEIKTYPDKDPYIHVLDKRQNGYKIAANSMYGGYGSDYSFTPFYPAAAATTAIGRISIEKAINYILQNWKDAVLVYGDSVTFDTPIFTNNGILPISEIGKDIDWSINNDFKPIFLEPINSEMEYLAIDDGPEAVLAARYIVNSNTRWQKESKNLENWQVWTDLGWQTIKKIIRHYTNKKIYKITTTRGIVCVTQDHSLLDDQLNEIKPIKLKIGDKLLYSKLPINHNANNLPAIVKNIECLGRTNNYVYDLETECGRFQAGYNFDGNGIGELIVKNTDSCMLHFTSCKTINDAFTRAKIVQKEINGLFPKPMFINLEKIYLQYFILSKKRYVGYYLESPDQLKPKMDKKGVVIKRRDNCEFLRDVYTKLIDFIMDKVSKNTIYSYLGKQFDLLLNGGISIEKLIITKSIKSDYKQKIIQYSLERKLIKEWKNAELILQTFPKFDKKEFDRCVLFEKEYFGFIWICKNTLPHLAVANKMRKRGKYVASGTRIKYIFIETNCKKDPQYLKAEDPDYYLENKDTLKIDYLYYLEKQCITPIDEVLEVKFGVKNFLDNFYKLYKKGLIKNVENHFKPQFLIN